MSNTKKMVEGSLITAIIILLSFTPIGMIPLPLVKATTVHIPVIIGAILLGPAWGAFFGGVFGLCSLVHSTMMPTIMSFAFSPFLAPDFNGAIKALWIAVGCRIIVGLAAGELFVLLKKTKLNTMIILPIVGVLGSLANTILVLGSMYILLPSEYASIMKMAVSSLFTMLMGLVLTSGVPEAIISGILVTAITKAIFVVNKTAYKSKILKNEGVK